ncbi:MAG: ATP-binding protein [Atopobiaceae bacterium]|nr:ATP-binding protein [Atopobiaceae bacterium]
MVDAFPRRQLAGLSDKLARERMNALVYAMIYAGSALMVYNIVRCYGFVKRMRKVSGLEMSRAILPIPLALLICFLIGYMAVALFGTPDFIIAGILFGGSVFVFIVFSVMYQIIGRLRESNARSDALYEETRNELASLTEDCLSVLRVNLTRNKIEERAGKALSAKDLAAQSYTELLASREERFPSADSCRRAQKVFARDELLKSFGTGRSEVEETHYSLMEDGQPCFVKTHATLAVQPGSGDVIAFITESVCNDEMVNETLINKALIGQYDAIASIFGGQYRVVIGDAGLHGDTGDQTNAGSEQSNASLACSYDDYLNCHLAPAINASEEDKCALLDSLCAERVESELARHEPYSVPVALSVGEEVRYKRFDFYVVDQQAEFFILLQSDTTEAIREERERNELLAEALSEAQRASQSKSTFLSNISHDIRTPMNAIVGYTDFAKKSDDPVQMREYLEKIDSSSKYMLALLNDVLEMSRIESGKSELDLTRASLPTLMDDVHELFERQMAEKGIAYSVDSSQVRDGCVICDKTRLNRVLLNLVSNAYKFTPEGGSVQVQLVQLDSTREGYGSYELHVKDTGIGMSEEFVHKIFDAFERERSATDSGIAGTGLGMAITRNIVDMMDGTIEVVSEQGRGTEFTVALEFELQTNEPGDNQSNRPCEPRYEPMDFTGLRALLVEDQEINREIATMILEDFGFEVDEAEDGVQALAQLTSSEAGCYDVVITDIQMPNMNGYELARSIRKLDGTELARTPIVAMSANAFQEDVKASHEAGMDAHVAKPIDVDILSRTLGEVLASAR